MFDIDEFKEIAEKLPTFKSLPDEGKYRTAIGRYYYYIFLKLREIAKEIEEDREDGIYGLLNSGKAHGALPAYFTAFADNLRFDNNLRAELIKLADNLSRLRGKRNKCDYSIHENITFFDVIGAKKRVDTIEQIITNISYQKPKSKTKIVGLKNVLKYFKDKDKLPTYNDVINMMYRR
ncbi:conserved hypothetical protein [Methanocaldococcus vulcanius M7]|uniref:Uncharacterized protein n=1 Tax=Methanocaldococcus vulcanius (strain ATCC 700851 / DSM 12094 / M7) TaxID=579137 RepID=C9RH29_METVM|nr:hypothetical protein [Methanocaldococcus vulcanius]ACX72881.1 conserved hypothetical protein [Methanocaldococcus vulcanius M7]